MFIFSSYQQQQPAGQNPGNYFNGYPENTEPGYGYMGYSPQNQPSQTQTGQQNFRSGSLPRSVRKESTSFEHSEPLPGNLTRWPRPDPRLHNGEAYVELTVTLQRHDSGFGFRIVGGTEEGSQVHIFLCEIHIYEFSNLRFSQNSLFLNLIFHENHIFKISILIQFTLS